MTRRDRSVDFVGVLGGGTVERGILALGVYISNELALKTTARSCTRPTNSYVGAIILVLIAEPDRVARCRGGKIKVWYYSYLEKGGSKMALFQGCKKPEGRPPSRTADCWAPLGPMTKTHDAQELFRSNDHNQMNQTQQNSMEDILDGTHKPLLQQSHTKPPDSLCPHQ